MSRVLVFKIVATLLFWSLPLVLLPSEALEAVGFPHQDTYMFVRMLGWAYFALCIGYWFALRSALQGMRALRAIWVGIFSNGGAFAYLSYYGITGTWSSWGFYAQLVGWGSVGATFLITLGLVLFGVKGQGVSA